MKQYLSTTLSRMIVSGIVIALMGTAVLYILKEQTQEDETGKLQEDSVDDSPKRLSLSSQKEHALPTQYKREESSSEHRSRQIDRLTARVDELEYLYSYEMEQEEISEKSLTNLRNKIDKTIEEAARANALNLLKIDQLEEMKHRIDMFLTASANRRHT